MELSQMNKHIELIATTAAKKVVTTGGFTLHRVGDDPTDALETVNRRYVTKNGTTSSRPRSSVIGQFYLDKTLNKPIWWNGTGWIDATGTFV